MELLYFISTVVISFAVSAITTHLYLRYKANKVQKVFNEFLGTTQEILQVMGNRKTIRRK